MKKLQQMGKSAKHSAHIKSKYNLGNNKYYEMLKEQNFVCKICGGQRRENQSFLSVDHCHDTGVVKKLLCNNCNVGLGFFKDNVENLQNAVKYLEEAKVKIEERELRLKEPKKEIHILKDGTRKELILN